MPVLFENKGQIGPIKDKCSWERDKILTEPERGESEQGKSQRKLKIPSWETHERTEAKRDQSKALGVLLLLGVAEMQVLKTREPRPSPVTGVAAVRGALPAPRCAPGVPELPKIAELLPLMGLASVLGWMLVCWTQWLHCWGAPRHQSRVWAVEREAASV